mgnify:CR=1 FL=1
MGANLFSTATALAAILSVGSVLRQRNTIQVLKESNGATDLSMISKGILVEHSQDGTHSSTLLNKLWPVGSVYISVSSTNPGTSMGFGTWVAFATGRTLVGIDTGQTEFDTVEETGGEKTHTLTIPEMPSHTHTTTQPLGVNANKNFTGTGFNPMTVDNTAVTINATGGGGAHNNLQPYIVTYMWKRTA